jgi:hypothetical protein
MADVRRREVRFCKFEQQSPSPAHPARSSCVAKASSIRALSSKRDSLA